MVKRYYIFIFLFAVSFFQNSNNMEFEKAPETREEREEIDQDYRYANFRYFIRNNTGQLLRVERSIDREWEPIMTIYKDQTVDITDFLKNPEGIFDVIMPMKLKFLFPADAPIKLKSPTLKLRKVLIIKPIKQMFKAYLKNTKSVIVPIKYTFWDGLKKGELIYPDLAGFYQDPYQEEELEEEQEREKPEVTWLISPEEIEDFKKTMKAFAEHHKEKEKQKSVEKF